MGVTVVDTFVVVFVDTFVVMVGTAFVVTTVVGTRVVGTIAGAVVSTGAVVIFVVWVGRAFREFCSLIVGEGVVADDSLVPEGIAPEMNAAMTTRIMTVTIAMRPHFRTDPRLFAFTGISSLSSGLSAIRLPGPGSSGNV
jgi:hypothetical protein